MKIIEKSQVLTTHKKLISMYKRSSSFIHNPFGQNFSHLAQQQKNEYDNSKELIDSFNNYLKEILWSHVAIGIETINQPDVNFKNPKNAWITLFGEYEDDNVPIILAVSE